MSGHIKLGMPSDLRDYSLRAQGNGISWTRGSAGPFSAKVNTSSEYDEIDAWNEWVQDNWQAGVGRVDPVAGGFLYGEAETRVPNQVILPPLVQFTDTREIDGTTEDCRYTPGSVAGSVTITTTGDIRSVALPFTTPDPLPDVNFLAWIYARPSEDGALIARVYDDDGGEPGTLVVSASFTSQGVSSIPSFDWYILSIGATLLSTATLYWLVLETTGSKSVQIAYGDTGYETESMSYNGTVWSTMTDSYILYATDFHRLLFAAGSRSGMVRFNGETYAYREEALSKYVPADNNWITAGTITGDGNVTSAVVFGPEIHFGRSTGNYTTMSTAEAFTAESVTRNLFLNFKGLLYGTWENDIYYTNNGSTWVGPFQVGGDDVQIRGLAGMGDSVYIATDKALMRLAPGNFVEEVSRFGAEDSSNGVGMIEYQGRLYIPAHGRLFRFDPSGQMQDIWVSRENDLVETRVGVVVSLCLLNNWLVAEVVSPFQWGRTTLWAWQEEGWHFIGSVEQHVNASGVSPQPNTKLLYDRENSRLWHLGSFCRYMEIDDFTLNPFNSASYLYMPFGWLEQDRFYGGIRGLKKAFAGVRVYGENLSSGVCVSVYWQDEDSTGWELLGTVDEDGEELLWTFANRPISHWIKLGFLLRTNDGDETPRVRSIVLRNLPIPNDRRKDTIVIPLKDYITMADGSLNPYTLSEQLEHIEGLIGLDDNNDKFISVYQDPLGVQYEVWIADHNMNMPTYAYENGNVVKELDMTLVLEQIQDHAYGP